MKKYLALLRAVNVGGTGKLLMSDLKAICDEAGFTDVQTYIASGNVVFKSGDAVIEVKTELEKRLLKHTGKGVDVTVRTESEVKEILTANPFPKASPTYSVVVFLDEPPPPDALKHATNVSNEEMKLGKREIYIYYPNGMGRSKLKIPAAKAGTARNMNTVAKLLGILSGL